MARLEKVTHWGGRALLAVLASLLWSESAAQGDTLLSHFWDSVYDGGNGGDTIYDVAIDSANNVYAAGYIQGVGTEGYSALLVKYDSQGDVALIDETTPWVVILEMGPTGGSKADSGDRFFCVAVDNEDNVVVAGGISGSWTGYSMGSYHQGLIVRKYNSAKELQWERIWQDGGQSAWQSAQDIAIDSSNNIFIGGTAFHAWDNVTENQWAILKYNPGGELQTGFPIYFNQFSQHYIGESAHGIAVDEDGSFTAVGTAGVSGTEGGATNNYDWHVRHYAADGSLLWSDTFAGTANLYDVARNVALDPEGNPVVGGYTNIGTNNTSAIDWDWKVIKYAKGGSEPGPAARLWEYDYSSAAGRSEVCYDLAVDEQGDVFATGSIRDDQEKRRTRIVKLNGEDGQEIDESLSPPQDDGVAVGLDLRNELVAIGGLIENTDRDGFTSLLGVIPDAPVITTNGGDDIVASVPTLLLEGTCPATATTMRVNGQPFTYTPGSTTWSVTVDLAWGANLFVFECVNQHGLISPSDQITVTNQGAQLLIVE